VVVHGETSVSVEKIIMNYLCFFSHPLVQIIKRILYMILACGSVQGQSLHISYKVSLLHEKSIQIRGNNKIAIGT
jgi:hypothetical protein